MKKLIRHVMIFTFGLLLYPISANAADTYRLDMQWVQDNIENKDFMSSSNCSYSALLLTEFGNEFFETTNYFIDDINWLDMSSFIQFSTFAPDNATQKMYASLDITINNEAIEVKDLDLIFYINEKKIVTKVEHKKKDVTKSFAFNRDFSIANDGNNNDYFNFTWGPTEYPDNCWFILNEV
tara:strand:+ start:47 stop:589 length:543 start_codon:yes stop_codon:yes gene_type:complete